MQPARSSAAGAARAFEIPRVSATLLRTLLVFGASSRARTVSPLICEDSVDGRPPFSAADGACVPFREQVPVTTVLPGGGTYVGECKLDTIPKKTLYP